MMKIIRVGDPHAKYGNLKESHALMDFVVSKFKDKNADRLELLGDLYDTHNTIRLEVQQFWHHWFAKLNELAIPTVVLVGNHDMVGDYSNTYSSLDVFKDRYPHVTVVNQPTLLGKIGYLPYIHDNNKFIQEANSLAKQGATVLVSHPNFEGAVYDNGTGISNGVSDNSLDPLFLHLIGGHIHTQLSLGRVWYIGTPRWLTKSCANKEKGIWFCDHDETGLITEKRFISTEKVCTPMLSLIWKEGESKPIIPKNAKVDIELVGPNDWVQKAKRDLIGQASISSKITDIKKSRDRKAGKSLADFLNNHTKLDFHSRSRVLKYFEGLGIV